MRYERGAGRKKSLNFVNALIHDRAEVVADFRQYYALDLPLEDISEIDDLADFKRLSVLYSALPETSRSMRKNAPACEWTQTDYLLWAIEFNLRMIQWGMLDKKARQGQQPPKPMQTPAERAEKHEKARRAEESKARINEILGITDN